MPLVRDTNGHISSCNSKRKLDDYSAGDEFENLFIMNKRVRNVDVVNGGDESCGEDILSWSLYEDKLQFFVKPIDGKSVIIRARSSDRVKDVMMEVERKSRIPSAQLRVIYQGKQLYDEIRLSEYDVVDDCVLHVVARLRSIKYCRLWKKVGYINQLLRSLCNKKYDKPLLDIVILDIISMLEKFLQNKHDDLQYRVEVMIYSDLPSELMKAYFSIDSKNEHNVSECIRTIFMVSMIADNVCLFPLILEFGMMLWNVSYQNDLYLCCRKVLGQMAFNHFSSMEVMTSLRYILPFFRQITYKISADLVTQSHDVCPSPDDIRDFRWFVEPLKHVVKERLGTQGSTQIPIPNSGIVHDEALEVSNILYSVYLDLISNIDSCLLIIENNVTKLGKECQIQRKACRQYLQIMKVLYGISKLYLGAEDNYRVTLGSKKNALSYIILTNSSAKDDPFWILDLKDLLDFQARRHLVLLLFPEEQYDYEEMNEMLIDRSNLLVESFEYIKHADFDILHSKLFVEFKNEEAAGDGVMREWFILVCQAIFYSGNPLFTSCPNDRRRFYLNSASTVDPLSRDYLRFCGRVIALALRDRVQVGILFDRVFFLQLAGKAITLEDIKDADPEFYRSCKYILDMDAEVVDTDALGLTFVREVDEMGSREVLELCHDGKNKVVNSHNRGEYIRLLIFNRFVASTTKQLIYFSQGFGDILANSFQSKFFFESLDLEDLDLLLQGSATDISVEDWKANTVYNGYNETDSQIAWFWKVVSKMSAEQRRVLLFFWTSIKYLPIEGFHGLGYSLRLSKVIVSQDRLPTSQTCFHTLCLPQYSSLKLMSRRLNTITQEHVGLSFGFF